MPGLEDVARNLSLRSHLGADRHPTLSLPTLYFALFSGEPGAGGVEPNATGGYVRVAKTNDATLWGVISASALLASNSGSAGPIVWPAATGLYSVNNLDWWAAFDNSAGGVRWYKGKMAQAIVITGAGDQPRAPAGTILINQAA